VDLEIEGRNRKGRPKRIYRQVVREDLKLMDVEEEEAEDSDYWRFRLDCMRFMVTCDGRVCHGAFTSVL
jgi:hypothetical protein